MPGEPREAWNVLLRVMQDEGITGRKRQRIEDAAKGYAAALPPVAPDLDVDSWADTMMDALRNSDDGNNPFYSDDEDTISLARQLAEAVVARRLRADKG